MVFGFLAGNVSQVWWEVHRAGTQTALTSVLTSCGTLGNSPDPLKPQFPQLLKEVSASRLTEREDEIRREKKSTKAPGAFGTWSPYEPAAASGVGGIYGKAPK